MHLYEGSGNARQAPGALSTKNYMTYQGRWTSLLGKESRYLAENLPDDLQIFAVVRPRQHQHLESKINSRSQHEAVLESVSQYFNRAATIRLLSR